MTDEDRVSDDDLNYELGPGMVNVLKPGESRPVPLGAAIRFLNRRI